MNEQRRALIVLSGLLLAARRTRADSRPEDIYLRIASARSKIRTLRGPFTQTRRIGLLVSEVRSTGDLALTRPDRLRWRLFPPDDVTFWVGPEGLAYRSSHGQGRVPASSAGVAGALDDLFTLIGGDMAKLDARWLLRLGHDAASGIEIEATGREASPPAGVRTMTFALTADLTRPTRVVLVEGPHDRTDIQFGDLRINDPIDPAEMRPP
jgi:outer membrane lipoprotein-sorting protein